MERTPMEVYCKYDVAHKFGSISECNSHIFTCPKRLEHERLAAQSHQKFTQNKKWIKSAQNAKKLKESELGGNVNAPTSSQMPKLRYQYMMNEPFIGGEQKTVESSTQANVHKRKVAYETEEKENVEPSFENLFGQSPNRKRDQKSDRKNIESEKKIDE
jgi:hypothetical protein